MTEQEAMGVATEMQQQPTQQPKLYERGNGEGLLMFWCAIMTLASITAGFLVSGITTTVPSRSGLFMEEVSLFGAAGGIGVALGGLCTAFILYGISRAIGLLKFIAARVDGVQPKPQPPTQAIQSSNYDSPLG